jgi:lipid-A-disaccharide synthase
VPSLAVYRVPRTTYFAERVLDRKPYMTITNKILRKSVIPEFIQGSLNPQRIADTLEQLLYDEQARGNMLKEFSGLDGELGETGAVERAVRLLLRMAGCGDHGTTSS